MLVVVGLGNFGKEYESTFHNVGFLTLDKVAEHFGKKINKKECSSELVVFNNSGEKIVLVKPLTYMNNSGEAVVSVMSKYDVSIDDMLVVVDDIDTPKGQIRIKQRGSSGSHNGLKSIIAHTGSSDFKRVKIGIGPRPEKWDLADYVLSKFGANDDVNMGIDKATDAVINYITERSLDSIMQKYNGKVSDVG